MVRKEDEQQPASKKDDSSNRRASAATSVPNNEDTSEAHRCKNYPRLKIALEVIGLGLLITTAVLTGMAVHYYDLQWHAMQEQTIIQRNTSMLAEDAWPYIHTGKPITSLKANGMVSVGMEIRITNAGKTPARQLYAQFAMRIVPNGEICAPDYRGLLGNATANVLVPGGTPLSFIVPLGSDAAQNATRILLSKTRFAQLKAGQYYVVTYGRVTYRDIFGAWHWEHFCSWSPANSRISAGVWCGPYNNMDRRRLGSRLKTTPPAGEPYLAGGRVHAVPLESASIPFCKRAAHWANRLFLSSPPGDATGKAVMASP